MFGKIYPLLLLLLIVACEPVKKPAEADAAKPPAEAKPLAPADHTVTFEVEITIDSEKPNGKGWDVGGGKPDPMVTIEAVGRDFKEAKFEEDATSATFTFGPMNLANGDTLTVKIEDKDLKNHDSVGTGELNFSPSKKAYEIEVESAKIEVRVAADEKAEEPPTPKLVLDVPAIVGKTQKEVAALLGNADRCEPIKYGTKCYFADGKTEIVFREDKADWITVNEPSFRFSKTNLPFLGLAFSAPTFENENVIRWENIDGLKEVSMFPGQGGNTHYIYIQAFTKP